MRIVIDNREHSLIETLRETDISFDVETLDLADIDIIGDKGQRFLIERKTIPDLASSLRDGRFKCQKDRLLGVLQREPMTAVAYVVEGSLGAKNTTRINGYITTGMVRTVINTLQFKYRIPVITSRNVKDTVLLIHSIRERLVTKPHFMPVNGGSNDGCAGHAELMPKISKNRKNDLSSIWSAALTAIQGVSKNTAQAVVTYFDNLPNITMDDEDKDGDNEIVDKWNLINYIRSHTKEDFEKELGNIRISNRRIHSKALNGIVSMFYPDIVKSPSDNIRELSEIDIPDSAVSSVPLKSKPRHKKSLKSAHAVTVTECLLIDDE